MDAQRKGAKIEAIPIRLMNKDERAKKKEAEKLNEHAFLRKNGKVMIVQPRKQEEYRRVKEARRKEKDAEKQKLLDVQLEDFKRHEEEEQDREMARDMPQLLRIDEENARQRERDLKENPGKNPYEYAGTEYTSDTDASRYPAEQRIGGSRKKRRDERSVDSKDRRRYEDDRSVDSRDDRTFNGDDARSKGSRDKRRDEDIRTVSSRSVAETVDSKRSAARTAESKGKRTDEDARTADSRRSVPQTIDPRDKRTDNDARSTDSRRSAARTVDSISKRTDEDARTNDSRRSAVRTADSISKKTDDDARTNDSRRSVPRTIDPRDKRDSGDGQSTKKSGHRSRREDDVRTDPRAPRRSGTTDRARSPKGSDHTVTPRDRRHGDRSRHPDASSIVTDNNSAGSDWRAEKIKENEKFAQQLRDTNKYKADRNDSHEDWRHYVPKTAPSLYSTSSREAYPSNLRHTEGSIDGSFKTARTSVPQPSSAHQSSQPGKRGDRGDRNDRRDRDQRDRDQRDRDQRDGDKHGSDRRRDRGAENQRGGTTDSGRGDSSKPTNETVSRRRG